MRVSTIPSCSTNVCGDRLHSTAADFAISDTSFFRCEYCAFLLRNSLLPIDFSTIQSMLSDNSCTHFTSAEYESVPASPERISLPISV